jgi:tetratricopeptide (TPR) repeat protein
VAKKPAPPALVQPAVPAEPDAIAILSRATQARVSGETAAAMRDFNLVIERFPGTPEAALSHAALGRLQLDRGDAAAALASFDAYLASKHQLLREDAQGSRAIALQALGRFDEERAAWEAVLHDYPQGVFAPRARTRLDSLTP